MKKITILLIVLLLPLFVFAHGEDDFAKAEEIIENKVDCNELADNQLEFLGDFYMEQMHPGELHEIMDERMGGEGSESLKQVHINMARSFYCGEHGIMSSEMMNIMMNRNNFDMMNGINSRGGNTMMGDYFGGYGMFGMGFFGWTFMLLILAALILLILWLIKQIQKK